MLATAAFDHYETSLAFRTIASALSEASKALGATIRVFSALAFLESKILRGDTTAAMVRLQKVGLCFQLWRFPLQWFQTALGSLAAPRFCGHRLHCYSSDLTLQKKQKQTTLLPRSRPHTTFGVDGAETCPCLCGPSILIPCNRSPRTASLDPTGPNWEGAWFGVLQSSSSCCPLSLLLRALVVLRVPQGQGKELAEKSSFFWLWS